MSKRNIPTFDKDEIVNTVLEYYGVDIFADTHKREIAFARQVAVYLLWHYTRMKVVAIAALFGRNHSSVSHSVKNVNNLCSGDRSIRMQVIELESKFE